MVATATAHVRISAPDRMLAAADLLGTSPEHAVAADFDGGGNSYSRDQLASVGLAPGARVRLGVPADAAAKAGQEGTAFTWPNAPQGRPETVTTHGQTITLDRPARTLSFVGSSVNGGTQATATVTLSDATTATADLSFGDWVLPSNQGDVNNGTLQPVYGNTVVAWTPVRNANSSVPGAYVFATTPYTAPHGLTVVSVTLPDIDKLRVFAIAQG